MSWILNFVFFLHAAQCALLIDALRERYFLLDSFGLYGGFFEDYPHSLERFIARLNVSVNVFTSSFVRDGW